jgi:ferredoxin
MKPQKPFKRWAGRPTGGWITARKIVQYTALALFVILFIGSRRGGWPPDLVNIPLRLDPLVMLAHLLSSRSLLAGSALALIVLILTLVFGRAWCGWLCPLGTTLDIFTPRRGGQRPSEQPAISPNWRSVKYGLLLVILVAALLGNLTLLILDPLTIMFRTLTVSLWPMVDQVVTAVEIALYRAPLLSEAITAFDAGARPKILPAEPVYYRDAIGFAIAFGVLIALNWAAPRFWCRYLCPLGGLLGLISKLALVRRQVGDACQGCTLCAGICPTGAIDPQKSYASDPGECTLCLDCLETCPRSLVAFNPSLNLAEWNDYDPGRRHFLVSTGIAVATVALFQSDMLARRQHPRGIQPPGGRANDLLAKCVRCGECLRACPTGGLQPAVAEAGLAGLWTPVLIPRLGYCDHACNACGQVCPVQAIPPLGLEEKRQQVIGKAYIDENRCIAWADHTNCIVCEEMCPLPEKAIQLTETEVALGDGRATQVLLPHVMRDRCIGCGICEYKCPLNGEAAIRVSVS